MLPDTLRFTTDHERLRTVIRNWIAEHDPGHRHHEYGQLMTALTSWQADLHTAGFIGLSWPPEYGGGGLDLFAEAVLAEELAAASMPQLINRLALYTWGPTILDHGTEEQKRRLLPGMLDASEIWCQGFSEPDAGSDLAAVRTTAVLDGDDLVVNGQKVWTSRAELSTWNAMLVRSDPSAERHSGLSILMVDMRSEGITIRPLPQMLNEPHFSEVFFDDVRVPVDNVLGDLHDGWWVAMAAMGYERGLFVLERRIGLQRRLGELVVELAAGGMAQDHAAAVGRLSSDLDLLGAQVYRTLAEQVGGTLASGSTSVDKLWLAGVYQDLFAAAYDALGASAGFRDDGWTHDLLESRSVSIYSGTSEIQRNVIQRQLLGLR